MTKTSPCRRPPAAGWCVTFSATRSVRWSRRCPQRRRDRPTEPRRRTGSTRRGTRRGLSRHSGEPHDGPSRLIDSINSIDLSNAQGPTGYVANSFHAGFGVSPPLLEGRDEVLEDFIEVLEDGPGAAGRATLYREAGGSGKTVKLNALEDRSPSPSTACFTQTPDRSGLRRNGRGRGSAVVDP